MGEREVEKLTKTLYTNSRLDLEFFMYLPTIFITSGKTGILSSNPVLYLRYRQNRKLTEEYDYAKAAYKITPRNLYHVIKFFNTILNWFYDEKYADLFLMNEEGRLVFNADYNKLCERTPMWDYDSCIMTAVPTIVEYGDKLYEGVHLYINRQVNCIALTYKELGELFGILRDFSFPMYETMVVSEYQLTMAEGRFDTGRFNANGTLKTPFD